MREQRKIMTALALTMLAVLLLVVLAAAVEGAPAAERPADWTEHQVTAHNVAQQLRALGYRDDNPVIAACQEWWRAEKEDRPLSVAASGDSSPQGASQGAAAQDDGEADTSSVTAVAATPVSPAGSVTAQLSQPTGLEFTTAPSATPSPQGEGYTTKEQRAEYPEAAYVWQLLKEAGLSDIHAAAILGNAMSESGGQTLAINIYQDCSGYWGAWAMSKQYFPDVVGQGADAQVAKILATLGEGFYATTDVRSAARWFSDHWERPAVWSEVRADNAEKALKYFGGAA